MRVRGRVGVGDRVPVRVRGFGIGFGLGLVTLIPTPALTRCKVQYNRTHGLPYQEPPRSNPDPVPKPNPYPYPYPYPSPSEPEPEPEARTQTRARAELYQEPPPMAESNEERLQDWLNGPIPRRNAQALT